MMKVVIRKFNFFERLSIKFQNKKIEDVCCIYSLINRKLAECVINPEFKEINNKNYFDNLVKCFSHEWVHKILLSINKEANKKFDDIAPLIDLGVV